MLKNNYNKMYLRRGECKENVLSKSLLTDQGCPNRPGPDSARAEENLTRAGPEPEKVKDELSPGRV